MAPRKGLYKGRIRAPRVGTTYYFGQVIARGAWLPFGATGYTYQEIKQVPEDQRREGGKTHVTVRISVRQGESAESRNARIANRLREILARQSPPNQLPE